MQQGYTYTLSELPGENFHPDFKPQLTPQEMLALGVFGGRYMTDCGDEFPAEWFANARLCHESHRPELNFFGVNASKPLAYWRAKGWLYHEDPAAGFSGTAATTWGGAAPMTPARSGAGWRSGGISPSCRKTVRRECSPAAPDSARRCCTGRMTAGSCDPGFAIRNTVKLINMQSMTVSEVKAYWSAVLSHGCKPVVITVKQF